MARLILYKILAKPGRKVKSAAALPFTVICELLGIPEPDRADLRRWFADLLAPYAGPQPPATAVAASDGIVGYLTALLDRKRAEPGVDLVTDIVVAERGGALTEQELLSTIFQLVVAGHDTTTSLIGNGTVALLRHPEQRDALVADPGLVPRAVEECMRFDAPVPHSTFRYATEETLLGGVVIPAFAQVIVSLAAEPGFRALPRRGVVRHPPLRPRHLPSATASTIVWVRRWPGSRPGSRCRRCTAGSPRCGWPSTPPVCTGGTATVWSCGGSPSSPSCSVLR